MNISDCMGCRHREEIPIPECCKKCENHKNYDLADIILTENGGLQEHQRQLKMAENSILFVGSKLSQIKIDRMNARNTYDDLLSTAKIMVIAEYDLKPSNQTIINAYATANEDVRNAKQDWLNKKAIEIKAKDRLDQLQGQRDTLKALVKSEHGSY
jgi:hypothetical protein